MNDFLLNSTHLLGLGLRRFDLCPVDDALLLLDIDSSELDLRVFSFMNSADKLSLSVLTR